MLNSYSLIGKNADLVFKPVSPTLIFTDLQHVVAMQNDAIDFEYEDTKGLKKKIIDIEKELFSELFLGNYEFNIAIYQLIESYENIFVNFNSMRIKRILNSNLPLNDDKNRTIFNMESNYALICDYKSLKKFVEQIDVVELEIHLDNENHKILDTISKKMEHSFAIASVHSFGDGFDFCGSGTYIIPRDSVQLINA